MRVGTSIIIALCARSSYSPMDKAVWAYPMQYNPEMKGLLVPGFELGGNVVWGATAMMLSEISDCCRDIFRDTFAS